MGINNLQTSAVNYSISSPPYQQQGNMMQGSAPPTSGATSMCCLIENGARCTRLAGNASYSKRIEKQVAQRKLQLVVDPRAHNNYICEHHKQIIQSIRTSGKRNKRKEDEAGLDDDGSMHDFNGNNDSSNDTMHSMGLSSVCSLNALPMNALRRYKRHFRISTKPGSNKTQLAEEMSRHFKTIQVNEKEVISAFMYMLKQNGNKLDKSSND